jgi:predicted metal-dependent hydrolase
LSLPIQLALPGLTCELAPIFRAAHAQLKPRTAVPEIQVEFFPFAGLNHTARLQEGRLLVRVSDIFTDAPPQIITSLALILLAKLYRKRVESTHHELYRTFILRRDIQERARIARTERGRHPRRITAQGRHIDLDACFDRLNREYFGGEIDKPKISWSMKRSRRTLGRYDATHHIIFISRLFDSRNVPPYVLNYVMFHEMLHVKHRSRVHESRVLVHTPEFRNEERRFGQYELAKTWLKTFL